MIEVVIQRDDRGRVLGLVARGVDVPSVVGSSALHFLAAVSDSLTQYLHVPVEVSLSGEAFLTVDRSDVHLDRELDAVLETLVIGYRMLERSNPTELAVHEASVGVEV